MQSAELRRCARPPCVAPDDGVISARSATVGSLTQPGQELFRLIRGGRLEWRAEVTAGRPGQPQAGPAGHADTPGRRRDRRHGAHGRADRRPADAQRRSSMSTCRRRADARCGAGMFARGEFDLGARPALTLPQTAVLLRDGFAYVFRLDGRDGDRSRRPRSRIGRRVGDRIEIIGGLDAGCAGRRQRRRLPRRRRHGAGGRRAVDAQAGRAAMNVSAWSIRNPIPAILLFVMLTLLGLLAFKAMKIQQFPDIDLPTVTVTATLPGAAPAQMETEVARKIENSIATLQGVKHIYTKVQDGTAIVTVEFRLEKPTQEAVDDVRDAVSRIRSDLPGDLRDPVISQGRTWPARRS